MGPILRGSNRGTYIAIAVGGALSDTSLDRTGATAMGKQEKRARSFAWPRGAVSTRVFADIDGSSNEGRAKAFKAGAMECLYGAKSLDRVFQDSTGQYILTFHALELALKAYLAKIGLSDKALRHSPFRHNLTNLYSAACEQGLSISVPQAKEFIEWMNCYHDKRSLIRYEFTGKRELPMCRVLFSIVEKVLAAV